MTEAKELSPIELACRVGADLWAAHNEIKLGNEIFSFKHRPYLIEPMTYKHPKKGAMKATQMGFSVSMALIPSIHGLIYEIYRHGVLYLFPSLIDMSEYSKSIIDPLIKDNPRTIGKYVKQAGRGVDTAGLKRIGKGNLYMRGAKLNPTDTSGGQSTRLSAISVDRVVYDEIDFMDSAVFADAEGRMKAIPEDKWEQVYLANPSGSDFGIDLLWQKSDMRYLYHPCDCGFRDNCPTKDFIDDPEKTVGIYPERGINGEERGYLRCKKCGKPLNVLNCEYRPDFPSRKEYVFWQCSHLSYINSNPARIKKDYLNPPNNDLGGVYKNDLGLPYSSAEEKLQKHIVLACCGRDGMTDNHTGPCAIGVDNDDGKHIVVGIRTANDRYELLKMARVDDFNGVYDLIRRYGIKFGVVDMRPNKDSATTFQKSAASIGCKIFLAEYTESPLQDANFNDNTGIVKIYRTGIFDTSHRVISNQQIVLPRQSPTVDEFARQCCNCAKQKNEKIKDKIVYNYIKTGDQHDHFRNALNYFIVAANRVRKVTRFKNETNQKYVIHNAVKL